MFIIVGKIFLTSSLIWALNKMIFLAVKLRKDLFLALPCIGLGMVIIDVSLSVFTKPIWTNVQEIIEAMLFITLAFIISMVIDLYHRKRKRIEIVILQASIGPVIIYLMLLVYYYIIYR